MTNHIGVVYVEKKLSCRHWLGQVQFVMKTKWDKNLTNHIGTIYTKNCIELLGPIGLGATYTKIRQNDNMTDLISVV